MCTSCYIRVYTSCVHPVCTSCYIQVYTSCVHSVCTSCYVHPGVHSLFPLDICLHFTVFTGTTQQLVKRSRNCCSETLTTLMQGYTALEWKERWYETNTLHTNPHPLCHHIVAPLHTNTLTVEPLYYKPLKCGNLYNKDTILCPSVVL